MKTVIIISFVNVFLYCSGLDPLGELACDEDGDGEFVCCKPFYERNSVCTVCPNGTAAKSNGADCTDCLYGFYGENCRAVCECKEKEICDNVYGCINYTKTTEMYKNTQRNTEINHYGNQAKLLTTLSISIAVISLLVILLITTGKCYSKFRQAKKSVLHAMTKKGKDKHCERNANIYGSYCSKSTTNNREEYDFDSDEFEEEDAYSEIRTSQMVPMTTFPVKSETMDQYDKYSQYNTDEYNHLNQMGIKRIPGQQQSKLYKYAKKNDARRLLTFEDEYI